MTDAYKKRLKVYLCAIFGEEVAKKFNGEELKFDEKEKRQIKDALCEAHKIRRFEIGLFWQRSIYFWGFLATFLAAFFLLLRVENEIIGWGKNLGLLIIAILGYLTALAWSYIDEVSKSWQENWEFHIDYLETALGINLHKTIFRETDKNRSVSKINSSFIFMVIVFWALISVWATERLLVCELICLNALAKWIVIFLPFLITWAFVRILAGDKRYMLDLGICGRWLSNPNKHKNSKLVLRRRTLGGAMVTYENFGTYDCGKKTCSCKN